MGHADGFHYSIQTSEQSLRQLHMRNQHSKQLGRDQPLERCLVPNRNSLPLISNKRDIMCDIIASMELFGGKTYLYPFLLYPRIQQNGTKMRTFCQIQFLNLVVESFYRYRH